MLEDLRRKCCPFIPASLLPTIRRSPTVNDFDYIRFFESLPFPPRAIAVPSEWLRAGVYIEPGWLNAPLSLIVLGGIWLLQGINVLPGSFMTDRFDARLTTVRIHRGEPLKIAF
jgi:hypothetical protein